MNLINIFGSNKKEPPAEIFLAVEIHESLIKSVCWQLNDGEPEVIGQGSFEMWEDEESLINGVDASITEAVKNIKPEPHRIIFGLPESWLCDSGIHPTKKNLIGKIVSDLKLTPIGVVPTTQAIAHYLKQRDGIPPTAILLEIFNTKIVVSVVKLGKVEAIEEVGASGDLARDVEEGLARMEFDSFPARFLLTDGGKLEDEQQQILSYPWQERLPFIHMPKVEILPVDLSVKAVALAGGTEAAQHLGLEVKTQEESQIVKENKKEETQEVGNIYIPSTSPGSDLADLGFSFEETSPPESIPVSEEPIIAEKEPEPSLLINEMPAVSQEGANYAIDDLPSPSLKKLPQINLDLSRFIPRFSFSFRGLPLVATIVILLFLIAVPAYYFVFGTATITVNVAPEKINKEISLAIAQNSQPDLPTLIATKKTLSGTAKEEIPTTGEALVGEKATGKITVFNRSSESISLKPGTLVVSDTGKSSFQITDSVTIASKSADLLSGKEEFGKKDSVVVKASKIGAEHNLGKNTTFTVDNYSRTILYAVSDEDFAGGTSRTVRAVDKTDYEKVLGVATDKIKEQTQSSVVSQDSSTNSLPLNDLHFTQKKYNHEIGAEATTVSVDLAGSVDLLVYSQQELFDLVKKELQKDIPVGLSFTPQSSQIRIENPTQKGEVYLAKAIVNATLFQQVDEAGYTQMLKGKTISKVKQLLQSINGYQNASATTSPSIPFLSSNFLPLNHISIEINPL